MPDDMHAPGDLPLLTDGGVSGSAALAQLRAYIADRAFKPGERLPPERTLCLDLGLKRGDLRRALEALERENRLWRHVGKGTFLTDHDPATAPGPFDQLASQVSPADVMRARAALEPAIAREAALHASASAIAKLRLNVDRARQAATWREYEALDNEFHRQIAESSGSTTLLALFDQLNTLRRVVSWGRVLRTGVRPPAEHSSFAEHARIVEEIALRGPEAAQAAMRAHLRSVENRLLG
ncbi:MAG: FadR/GntR family transcriptional regulator [Gemmobacter sp.]